MRSLRRFLGNEFRVSVFPFAIDELCHVEFHGLRAVVNEYAVFPLQRGFLTYRTELYSVRLNVQLERRSRDQMKPVPDLFWHYQSA